MDDAMRARFRKALESKGISKGNWAEASAAVIKPDGKHLGRTFIRDAIERGKGKDEFVEYVTSWYEISWDYVKFDKGSMPQPSPAPAHNNRLDNALSGAKRMLDVLSLAINELLDDDNEAQLMLVAIVDAVGDKIDAAEKSIEEKVTKYSRNCVHKTAGSCTQSLPNWPCTH